MPIGTVVRLEWKFTPPDYFEEVIEISRQDYVMTIEKGEAHAKVDASIYEANPDMRKRLHDSLNDRFRGVQLLTHRAYDLSRSTMTRVHPDGRRDIFVELETAQLVLTGGTVDVRVTDKDGNVVSDSRRDRIEQKRSLAELISLHRATDPLLAALLRSQAAAVRDPNNELVPLYEIRDALSTQFGGDNAARKMLGISTGQWSRLGSLCNNEPLRQGRHRGKTGTALRDATEAELMEARHIARAMIEAYLRSL